MTLPLRCPGCRRPRPRHPSLLPGPATSAAGLFSDPKLGRAGAAGRGGAAGAPPPSPRLRVAACARELRRRRRPGTGSRAAVMLSRLGALLQEAMGAVRPGTLGRAGPGPEGRARGRGRSRPARGRAEGAGRLQEGTPPPGPWCPFSGLLAPPPRPSRGALPASSGFFPNRACSQLLSRSLWPLTLLPGLLPVYFSCSPSLFQFPNSSVPSDP